MRMLRWMCMCTVTMNYVFLKVCSTNNNDEYSSCHCMMLYIWPNAAETFTNNNRGYNNHVATCKEIKQGWNNFLLAIWKVSLVSSYAEEYGYFLLLIYSERAGSLNPTQIKIAPVRTIRNHWCRLLYRNS